MIVAAADASARLSSVLAEGDFTGWDPYDALASPALRTAARTPLLRTAAIQALKRSPLNFRRLVGVRPMRHTKALALFVSAFTRLGDDATARVFAAELADRALDAGEGVGWGYDFDVQTRWGYYPQGTANAIATSFALNALIDVGGQDDVVAAGTRFIRSSLTRSQGQETFFAYYDRSTTPIHNANVLVASTLVRALGGADTTARQAVRYTLDRQRSNGSWPYGDRDGLGWVDGFHTAYVLEGLDRWARVTASTEADDAIRAGLDLYLARLVDPDGAARATLDARYPVETHALASGVTMLVKLRERAERAMPTAERMLEYALAHMRRPDGRFAFQQHRRFRNSVPYVRWSDAHMQLALANYLDASRG